MKIDLSPRPTEYTPEEMQRSEVATKEALISVLVKVYARRLGITPPRPAQQTPPVLIAKRKQAA